MTAAVVFEQDQRHTPSERMMRLADAVRYLSSAASFELSGVSLGCVDGASVGRAVHMRGGDLIVHGASLAGLGIDGLSAGSACTVGLTAR